MRLAYSVAAVRAAEAAAMAELPDGELMQRASFGLAAECIALLRERHGSAVGRRCLLLVGSGGNGGDALWAGAFLARRGVQVTALLLSERVHEPGRAALLDAGGRIIGVQAGVAAEVDHERDRADLILDGITGIGGVGPLRPQAAAVARAAADSTATIVAVDIPSGVDADTGVVADPERCVRADVTVTFGCPKPGHLVAPGRAQVGRLRIVDIGLDLAGIEPAVVVLDEDPDLDSAGHPPRWNDHKYSRGVVGVIAGCSAYPGAAVLAVGAARRTGCGMVRLVDRDDRVRSAVLAAYPDVVAVEDLADARTSGWLCGPGLGTDARAAALVAEVLAAGPPLVLDADALRLVAEDPLLMEQLLERGRQGRVTVLLPHDGEFARLGAGRGWPEDGQAGRRVVTRTAADDLGAIIVRKGPGTLTVGPSGVAYVEDRGPADLATAGTGDVLAGLVAGFLAAASRREGIAAEPGVARLDPVRIVAAAVGWHARAARSATGHHRFMTAADLLDHLDRIEGQRDDDGR